MEPRTRARELRTNATPPERMLWRELSARKVLGVRFNRQVPIGPFVCDFVARSAKVIVEVDGGQHTGEGDAARTRYLGAQGFRIIRFWNNDVLQNLDGVWTVIEEALSTPPHPPR